MRVSLSVWKIRYMTEMKMHFRYSFHHGKVFIDDKHEISSNNHLHLAVL